jgi:membrane protein DedA with SNARE-associated domain
MSTERAAAGTNLAAATVGPPIAADGAPPRRVHLAVFLVPMALVFASAQVGRAVWPSLLTTEPWSLLLLSSNWTRLLIVQPLVPAIVFFALTIGRIVVLAPLYYFFGRDYGDAGLRWGERKLGPTSKVVPRIEHYFRRFSYLFVAFWWSALVCIMAGATGMRARIFFPLIVAGTVVRVTAIYFVGDALSDPITEFTQFVGRYALIITPITIALTVAQLWYSQRKRRGLPVGTIDDLEAGFEVVEAEVAGEATVTSPAEPD